MIGGLVGELEYFKDAVDRVCHMEPVGEVMVDHVAVALLYRCNTSGYFVGYYDQWSLPRLGG